MKIRIIIALAVLAFCVTLHEPARAQQRYHLTLDESIDIAKTQSYSMLSLLEDTEIAVQNLKATIARYRTRIDLTLGLPTYTKQVTRYEESGGIQYRSIEHLTNNLGLTIRQPLPTDGSVYVRTSLTDLYEYNNSLRHMDLYTEIGLEQSIHSLWGYNDYKSSIKQARLAYDQSRKLLKRTELDLVYQVSTAYYSLLRLQKSEEIAKLNLERQEEAYEISKNKYEAGLIREVDALQMDVDLAEAQSSYDMALLDHASADNTFKELLGLELDAIITLNSSMDYEMVAVDPEFAVERALATRLEIQEQDIQIERQKIAIKQSRSARQPSVNLQAYYRFTGLANNKHMPTGYGDLFSETFRTFANSPTNFTVGLNVSIPIFNWGQNKANLRAAQARLRQFEYSRIEAERSVEIEVRNQVANLTSTLKRLQLLEKNVAVAEKSFEITLKRYSDGDIDSQALALERQRLNTAYTSHLSAYINYQLTLADLTRKTFYDFRTSTAVE